MEPFSFWLEHFRVHDEYLSYDNIALSGALDINYDDILPLRPAAKNLVVSANALIKVFKARFDDNRSWARIEDFSTLPFKQPLISGERPAFEATLVKNGVNYVDVDFAHNTINRWDTPLYSGSLENFRFFNFPFLIGNKSEAGRFI